MVKQMKTTIYASVKRNCYSYTRFSSSAQADGDSARRQIEKTLEFCQRHNLELNETRYEDLGVSGWTGENIEKGALGDFIAAVKAGKIPKGSALIVENWDRFSRLKPMDAYTKLGEIIKAGVDVVTLEDGKFHTAENYNEFTTLITSLVIMERANEESARKSRLISAACEQKRKQAIAGKGILNGNCPPWLKVNADKTGFEVRPERVAIVHRIIKLIKEGKGKREISRMFDAEKVPTWGSDKNYKNKNWAKRWRDNYLLEVVKSRALVGELKLQRRKRDTGEVIVGYYPAIIDEATWQSIQPKKIKTFNAGPQSDANNLFSGLLYDGYNPDFRMKFFMQDKAKGYIYLSSDYATVDPLYLERRQAINRGEKTGPRPLSGETIRYNEFEAHFLRHFSEIDLFQALPERTPAESSRIGLLENDQKDNDKALANLVKALESGEPSAVVMEQINKREATARRLAKELEAATDKERRQKYTMDSFEEEHQRILELLGAETREARMSLRTLFHRVIERIDIFPAGVLDVPDDLRVAVYPDRYGMMCYKVKLVGSHPIWIWWDGCQAWEQGEGQLPSIHEPLTDEQRGVIKAKGKLKLPEEWLAESHRRQIPKRQSKLTRGL
jgi:DNA invertase Pin-like site-specific DNA recombinase